MSRNQTLQLKGIAIVFVLLGHGLSWLTSSEKVMFKWGGALGVALFLYISGYGLMKSYIANKHLGMSYWKRRITSVMIPFWVVMLIQTLVNRLLKIPSTNTTQEWVISFLGWVDYDSGLAVIDPTMWYITFAMGSYFLFFFVFSFKISDGLKVVILSILTIALFNLNIYLTVDWMINYFSFTVGVLLGYFNDKLDNDSLNSSLLIVFGSLFVIFSNNSWMGLLGSIYVWRLYAMLGAGTFWLIVKLFRFESRLLISLGKHSYFIYLFEGWVIQKGITYFQTNYEYLNIILYIVITLVLAFLFNLAYKKAGSFIRLNRSTIVGKNDG